MAERSHEDRELWFREPSPTGISDRLARLTSRWRPATAAQYANGTLAAARPSTLARGELSDRVAQARHEAGLTTKQLADLLRLSVYKVEQLESGREDAALLVPSIAAATDKQVSWFQTQDRARGPGPAVADPRVDGGDRLEPAEPSAPDSGATQPRLGANVVLTSLVVLVVVRFFTEVVAVLPRFAQFVDIPILGLIGLVALLRPLPAQRRPKLGVLLVLAFAFVLVCALAMLTNLTRVDIAPALTFVYGFLGPIALFFAVYTLWPVGAAVRLSRTLVALCVLQLVVVLAFDVPEFLSDGNPDVFSGTFGENAYQLVFFLLLVAGLLAGVFTFEKRRFAARLTPFLLVAILAVIFLAQYRSLLVTTVLVVVLLGALLSSVGLRGLVIAVLAASALLGTLSVVAQNLPGLKFGETLVEAREDPTFYLDARLSTLDVLGRLFGDTPRYAITGTGPGTYSSRAWRTFAITTSNSQSDVAGDYVTALTQGRPYRTDVSDKYVVPQLRNQEFLGGSSAATRPFASYLSLLAEVGVLGFLVMVAIYVWALVRSTRMTLQTGRRAGPGDPLPALFCASTVGFFVLLQMGALDNWFEVTRITFVAWLVFAVASKELDGRKQLDA